MLLFFMHLDESGDILLATVESFSRCVHCRLNDNKFLFRII